ncbi:MAG: hypothetical protein ABIF12_02560 [bacterium]
MQNIKLTTTQFITLIILILCSTQNIFSMRKSSTQSYFIKPEPEPKPKLPKQYSSPDIREKNSTPGTLQELLIASGFFFLEEYVLELINLYKQEEIIISQGKNILKKRKLKKWKRENIKKIRKITTQIKLLEERIDIFFEEYKSIITQRITNIRQEEINRITLNSNESLPNLLDNLKLYLKDKDNDILEWILETIKSQKEIYFLTISEDILKRPWQETTLPDLIKDTEILSQLADKSPSIIWNSFINKTLLNQIFSIQENKLGRKEVILRIQALQKTFDLKI